MEADNTMIRKVKEMERYLELTKKVDEILSAKPQIINGKPMLPITKEQQAIINEMLEAKRKFDGFKS
jgi:hypothetical protein